MWSIIWFILVITIITVRMYFRIQNKRGWGLDTDDTDTIDLLEDD